MERILHCKLLVMVITIAIVISLCVGTSSIVYGSDQMNRVNMKVSVNGQNSKVVKAYNASYAYNTYVSLDDLCNILNGTDKQMSFYYDTDKSAYYFVTGAKYKPIGNENKGFDGATYTDNPVNGHDSLGLDVPNIYINGKKVEYRIYPDTSVDKRDAYMKLVDLGLIFGIRVNYTSNSMLSINTKKNFEVNMKQLNKDGYFEDLDGVYLGNATTGKKLYSWDGNQKTEIASTTKLMTFLLVEEAIKSGKITMNQKITLSKAVVKEANSEDGTYDDYFTVGKKVKVRDLLGGMLMVSANECATALAEAVSGSETKFVTKMNVRAKKMGLRSAKFLNPHGLPSYTMSQTTGKRQNKMSASDMFKLSSYLLKHYKKQLTAYTAKKYVEVPSIYTDKNGVPLKAYSTSSLVYNMDNCLGLKTGTTNRSGACLVAAIKIKVAGKTQNIVAVVFGAEDNRERYESTTMLLKYAEQYYAKKKNGKAKIAVVKNRH